MSPWTLSGGSCDMTVGQSARWRWMDIHTKERRSIRGVTESRNYDESRKR
jgi:hypothetical protein